MTLMCATRARKNLKYIRSVAPDLLPAEEPAAGYTSIIPFNILRNLHRSSDDALRNYPNLLEVARKMRSDWQSRTQQKADTAAFGLFPSSSFQGTLYLVQPTFMVNGAPITVSDADVATVLQYLQVALPQISKYCSAFGENKLAVSSTILRIAPTISNGTYNDDDLQNWVRGMVSELLLQKAAASPGSVCMVFLNPVGVVNSSHTRSVALGHHDSVMVPWLDGVQVTEEISPYCFVNLFGSGFTVNDPAETYAFGLSHEVAEMTVDPGSGWTNPEVCDSCSGNCGPEWHAYFEVVTPTFSRYLGTGLSIPKAPANYDFYVCAVVHPADVNSCPGGDWGCDFGPDDRAGLSELLFYDRSAGYGELYSVDGSARPALQTIRSNWRNSWSLIVPAGFTKNSPLDLLFYDASAGVGEVYKTGNLGQINRLAAYNHWRNTWSIILPGKFSSSQYVDLMFYDPSAGHGEFYHTNGRGEIGPMFASYDKWRTTWSIIVPGKFSDSGYTDLLFYDPTSGTGEFYSTGNGLGPRFASYTTWRTTWSLIVPGHFSNSNYTDLLFYDRTSGTGEFYPTGGGLHSRFAGYTNWRTSWAAIVAGQFSNSQYQDLLFYDRSAGVGEIYPTGGGLHDRLAGFTDWRTSWDILKCF